MSLQLILGNSGAGKTHYLYEEIIKKSIEQPDRNFIILVPEQYTMATQKELVKRHPRGGILNIDVLSLGRLAHRIYSELGMTQGLILDDEGKNLVLRRISKDYEGDLKVLGKNLKKFGYISEVKSLISEFGQYDLGLDGLEELLGDMVSHHSPATGESGAGGVMDTQSGAPGKWDEGHPVPTGNSINKDSMLAYKLEDIQKIYRGFQEYLEGKYITGEEHLDGLTQVVGESQILKNSIIALDGFTGFTPVQNRLLEALLKAVETVYVTVTIDEDHSKVAYRDAYELFALSKEMIETLTRLATDNGVKIDPLITMFGGSVKRHGSAPELAFLESKLFRHSNQKYNQEMTGSLHMEARLSPWDESLWVAHKVRNLVRTKGYRYSDIAIVASDMQVYDGCMKRAMEAYGIPVFSDTKKSVLLNSFVEYLRSLLEMMDSNYGYQETFRYLKSGMSILGSASSQGQVGYGIFTAEAVDTLENHVLKHGIKGFKSWQQPWGVDCDPKEQKAYQYLNAKRVIFVEHISLLQVHLKQNRKTVKDICTSLYEFFQAQNIEEKIQHRSEYFGAMGELALEKEYQQVYTIILELMDKFVAILGEEQVSLGKYIELLDAGLEEARIGIVPPSVDTVILGDLQRTRVDHIKALFYVGVSDLYVPGKMNAGGLLSEGERDHLEAMQVKLKPNSKAQMYLQKFYLYLVLTKPSEGLFISYAKSNSQGKSGRPAYLINELRKMFPQLHMSTEELSLGNLELSPKVGLDFVVQGFRDKALYDTAPWQGLYQWYMDHESGHLMERIKEARYYKRLEMALPAEVASDLYGALLQNSVSRLEKYAACPYAHFLNYGLRLKEREVYEFKASDIGTILHDAMEEYARRVEAEGRVWADISQKEQSQWAHEAIEGQVRGYNNHVFEKTSRDEYMIHRMKRLMERSVWAMSQQLSCGDFIPKGFEVSFGYPDDHKDTGLVELSDDTQMMLRGQIDRVDLWSDDDKILVKVVDYKTGKKELSLESMYHGLQLQLFVYLDAAIKHYGADTTKQVLPGGVFYYRVDDPLVSEQPGQGVAETILHALNLDGLVNEAAIHLMDRDLTDKSYAIPVGVSSKGAYTKGSKNMSQEQLLDVMEYAKCKVEDLGREIIGGSIPISPYKKAKETGCDYCQYGNICGFDTTIGSYDYRELSTMKSEEVLEQINKKKGEL